MVMNGCGVVSYSGTDVLEKPDAPIFILNMEAADPSCRPGFNFCNNAKTDTRANLDPILQVFPFLGVK
jgi:hypothetical protein